MSYTYQRFADWKAAVSQAYPQARIVGDKRHARAFLGERQSIAHWLGRSGFIDL